MAEPSAPQKPRPEKPPRECAIGDLVHYVIGGSHVAAFVTGINYQTPIAPNAVEINPLIAPGPAQTALLVIPPMQQPFHAMAPYGPRGIDATWHWPEEAVTLPALPEPEQLPFIPEEEN